MQRVYLLKSDRVSDRPITLAFFVSPESGFLRLGTLFLAFLKRSNNTPHTAR